jgi:phage terminase large subunit-like protein
MVKDDQLEGVHPHYVPPEFRGPVVRFDPEAWKRADPATIAQAEKLLAEWQELKRANPLWFYEAAGWKHHQFHLAQRPRSIRFLSGGNRAGKTTTGSVDSIIQMTPRELVPPHLHGYKKHDCDGGDGPYYLRVVVPDLKRTGKPIHEKFSEWVPKGLFKGGSYGKAWRGSEETLQLECGCFMELLSTEMDINKHGGSKRHRIQFDEEPPEDYFTENMMRLTDFGGDALFTMTPLSGLTWVYREIWKKRDLEHISAFQIGMRHNRHLTSEDVDFVLSLIKNEAERKQREWGEFSERGGAIYPNFMDAIVPHPERDFLRWRDVVIAVDPGLSGAGLVWIAFDRDNCPTVFASAMLRRATVEQYVAKLREVNRAWGITDYELYVDPAAESGNLVDGRSVMDAFIEAGEAPIPADNSVEAGIGHVQNLLNKGYLKVSQALTGLHDEAVEYAEEQRDDGIFKPKKTGREHRLDALRYGLMSRRWAPVERREQIQGVDPLMIATAPPRRLDGEPESVMGAMS